jgi:hypothetical protein
LKPVIGGYVWLDKSALTQANIGNIQRALTIHPRSFSEFSDEEPEPILLFSETEDRIGVPRQFFLENRKKNEEMQVETSVGSPTSAGFRSAAFKGKTDGRYAEQTLVFNEFIKLFTDEERLFAGGILQAGCAFGKALANGEPVLTASGERPIESLSVGDKVYGTDGKLHSVTGVFPQGIRSLYRLKFTDGTHVDCDEDHLWAFEQRRKRGLTLDVSTIFRLFLLLSLSKEVYQ